MFAGQPQPVEIHHRGIWYSGELIGWRHESGGRVSARVRCRIDKLRHSAWVDLDRLRLPDPKHPPRKEPYPAALPRAAAEPDDPDGTRPHTMLAGLTTRAPKPAHVTLPPPRELPAYEPSRHEPSSYEPEAYEPDTYEPDAYEPVAYEPAAEPVPAYDAAWESPSWETPADAPAAGEDWSTRPRRSTRPRPNEQLRRYEAYLSVL
jgi:hypothetical protein